MNEEFYNGSDNMEDIRSSSKKKVTAETVKKAVEESVEGYGNGIFKSLATIIKAIAFFIGFIIFAVCLIAAYVVYFYVSRETLFMVISIGIVIFGIVTSTITMFLIYALGHAVGQNNEILYRLRKLEKRQ